MSHPALASNTGVGSSALIRRTKHLPTNKEILRYELCINESLLNYCMFLTNAQCWFCLGRFLSNSKVASQLGVSFTHKILATFLSQAGSL
jgi:hypothetical protein